MPDHLSNDFGDSLDECVEAFWKDNPELKRRVLQDWYNGTNVTGDTNIRGFKAVTKWLDKPLGHHQ